MLLKRRLKNQATLRLRQFAEVAQRFGWNITPDHFYADMPKFRTLRTDSYWCRGFPVDGIPGMDLDSQRRVLEEWMSGYMEELGSTDVYREACQRNGEAGYGPIECQLLHAFVRKNRPGKIVQVGCGVSTAVILGAAEREGGYQPEVVCVEPFPTGFLEEEGKAGRIRLVREGAQKVDLEVLASIPEGGLLFVDSTHTTHVGSEVNRLILEVLPALGPGVYVHFHDIFIPYDYHPAIMRDLLFFGRESTLLHAFLLHNERYRVSVSQYMLNVFDQETMRRFFPGYRARPLVEGVFATTEPTYGAQTPEKGYYPSAIYIRRH
ncbi:MAG: class I SAM-dependent methyltransferase [Phycisphaeraceae bacterium]|nr:MAG: class I SAM-dependent methyltransferase [Phycisphaeraceae bacterium]